MIGTPALSSAYICRLNSMSSATATRRWPNFRVVARTSPFADLADARAGTMSTGVVPSVRSCVATAALSAASITPSTARPVPSRPR